MQTHVVPVGFDYDRLIAPLVREQLTVDRVILLEGAVGSEANVEYSQRIAQKLEADFRNLLGAETERVAVTDVYDYDAAFEQAFDLIADVLDADPEGEVWVNIASMPRTVSFAFATAAHSIMVERQEDRDRIHTYYTAPRSTWRRNSPRNCGRARTCSRRSRRGRRRERGRRAAGRRPGPAG